MDPIIRGSTPSIHITFEDVDDASIFDKIKVIMRQCNVEIEKKKDSEHDELDITGNVVSYELTQAETYMFKAGVSIALQVRATYQDAVYCSDIQAITVYPNLEEELMS